MLLIKDKLKIRNAREQDAKILCKWWNDGNVMSHAGFPNGLGTNEEKIAKSLKNDNDQNRRLIIEFEEKPIGEMNYRTPEADIAQIGIKICDFKKQNKGIGTKCLNMLINHLFTSMGYNKVILDTNLNNVRAQHVYEKIGFRKIGTRLNAWKDQLGNRQSAVDYELTKADYFRNF